MPTATVITSSFRSDWTLHRRYLLFTVVLLLFIGAELIFSLTPGPTVMLISAYGFKGGFRDALAAIAEAVANAGYKLGTDVTLALDCASSEFFEDGKYDLAGEGKVFSAEGFAV